MVGKPPPIVDRFGRPILKQWQYPSPKPDTWDALLDDGKKDLRVLTPEAARQQRPLRVAPGTPTATERADRLGSSKSKSANVPPTNIRKRKLILDD